MQNIFESIPGTIEQEIVEELIKSRNVRIERILSKGQCSPEEGWYDQDEHEWVMVLSGAGVITFEDGKEMLLEQGDFVNIPKHKKHKVSFTQPDTATVWLAVFYH